MGDRVSDEQLREWSHRDFWLDLPEERLPSSQDTNAMARELLHHREQKRQLRALIADPRSVKIVLKIDVLAILDSPEGGTTDADT